jgi:hypothetical protein
MDDGHSICGHSLRRVEGRGRARSNLSLARSEWQGWVKCETIADLTGNGPARLAVGA